MRLTAAQAFRISALLGFLGVALGAFGAHWLKAPLSARHMVPTWEKAVFYHLLHAAVMLTLASGGRPFSAGAWTAFGVGVALFSGSLYALALTGMRWLVFLTPLGGLCLLAGWFWLMWRGGALAADDERNNDPPRPGGA